MPEAKQRSGEPYGDSARPGSFALELLLLVSVLALILQLTWRGMQSWRNRPFAGRQVEQFLEDPTYGLVNYLLYLPVGYEVSDQAWPLVVYLHGSGLRGSDPALVAREGPPLMAESDVDPPFVLVSPQCRANRIWDAEVVHEIINHITANYHIDPARIYLTGYSMGGFGTWATAAKYPDLFAGIAPLCGGGSLEDADKLADLPVWMFHGEDDGAVPLSASEEMVLAVNQAGGQAKLTIIPNAGHQIWSVVYRDSEVFDWLLAQRRGADIPVCQ